MFSKNIHQRPSIFLMLLIGIYLIHSSYGESVLMFAKEARTLKEPSHVGNSQCRLSEDDVNTAKAFVNKLLERNIVIHAAFTATNIESTMKMDFIKQERNQITPNYRITQTESLNMPTSSETAEMMSNRITSFWITNVKPLIDRGLSMVVVAPDAVLEHLVYIRGSVDGYLIDYTEYVT